MNHWDTLRVFGSVGLVCGVLGLLSHRRAHPENARGRVLWGVGLALWAIGLALSFAGI
jgi:hypothetical protein